jgi:hypothetical protein
MGKEKKGKTIKKKTFSWRKRGKWEKKEEKKEGRKREGGKEKKTNFPDSSKDIEGLCFQRMSVEVKRKMNFRSLAV